MSEKHYVTASYLVETSDAQAACQAICRGQSVGNPTILTPHETREFLEKWCASGKVSRRHDELYLMRIKFPDHNFGAEGISYLLSVLMGGQCDIDVIRGCRLITLELGSHTRHLGVPRYGIQGLRELCHVKDRPFLCGIIKPKIGLSPQQLGGVVGDMVEGGCDIIKEDEILASQYWCPLRQRLTIVKKLLQGTTTVYLACVTADGSEVWKRARIVAEAGDHFGVHCNIWAGFGPIREISQHVKCPVFFQKSGDKVWTTGPFSIEPAVLYQLVPLLGCDMAHVGMYVGYLSESLHELQTRIQAMRPVLPSFSCGMTPASAEQIVRHFGSDLMITSGGWIHGQPEGTAKAVRQLRQTILTASKDIGLQERMGDGSLPADPVLHTPL